MFRQVLTLAIGNFHRWTTAFLLPSGSSLSGHSWALTEGARAGSFTRSRSFGFEFRPVHHRTRADIFTMKGQQGFFLALLLPIWGEPGQGLPLRKSLSRKAAELRTFSSLSSNSIFAKSVWSVSLSTA